jgi:hypothetical protein
MARQLLKLEEQELQSGSTYLQNMVLGKMKKWKYQFE